MAKLSSQMQFSVIVFTSVTVNLLHSLVSLVNCSALSCTFQQTRQEFLLAENREFQKFSHRETVTRSYALCVRDCHADRYCKSVNYHTSSHHCSLNNATRSQFPDFITNFGSLYYDADVDTPLYSKPCYSSCKELREAGHNVSGIYTIFPAGLTDGLQVYCDMETDGGGWIVIQRRQDGSVDFYRNWADYHVGFGNLSGEFWIGNDILRSLTESGEKWKLRVDLEDWDNITAFAEYGVFEVTGDNYTLRINSYHPNSTAGDSLAWHNGMRFTTKDKDNDKVFTNCAITCKGAWWYRGCYYSNLNGKYYKEEISTETGTTWKTWKNHNSLKTCTMKICPL